MIKNRTKSHLSLSMLLDLSKPVNEMRFIVNLKYESSTIILFFGIRYSMRALLLTSITMPDRQNGNMRQKR